MTTRRSFASSSGLTPVVIFAAMSLAACGDAQPGNVTRPPAPYPPEFIPSAPPPHRAPARTQLVTEAVGHTIWPVEQPLQFQVFAFDAQGAPTSATPDFSRSGGSGLLVIRNSINSDIGLVSSGMWQIGEPPSISRLDIALGPNVGAWLLLEAVFAATAPSEPVRYVLDSIDGRRPPFSYDEEDDFRFQVIGVEAVVHNSRYVLRHLLQHPVTGLTSSYGESGTVQWYNGVARVEPDSAYFPTRWLSQYNTSAVMSRDGRLQIASRSGNVWPRLGTRYDFRRVP